MGRSYRHSFNLIVCLYKVKVNYSRISIVQASDLKERLEELNI